MSFDPAVAAGDPAITVVHASAPGRVNLIGEHTDYNGGFVLPTAIPQKTRVELTRRTDRRVQARSQEAEQHGAYTLGDERKRGDWLDYVQGLTWALSKDGFDFGGFELCVSSEVPAGAGLSSSAALEVAVLRALRAAFDLDLSDVHLARLGQIAENEFVGARVGIMDQMAANLADERTALFLDTRSLDFRRVPLPSQADLVVIHSGVLHEHSSGDYNARRAECEEAARRLGVAELRDLSPADLARVELLPDPLGRRARHVLTENARVLETVAALESGALERVGDLFHASHISQRDDFDVSVPDVDLLVDIAQADPAIFGARLSGGGFGGSVVVLARQGQGRAAAERITATYAARSARRPTVLVPAA
jgi:galactokinase